ncbi:hypothetical protein SMICM304S_02107 [Streptomyces microflavus]
MTPGSSHAACRRRAARTCPHSLFAAAKKLCRRATGKFVVHAEVVEVECLTDRPNEGSQAVLLELGDVRLPCQDRDVDAQDLGDCRDEVGGCRLGAALDLVEEAVGVRKAVGQLPLGEAGQLPLFLDTCACVVVVPSEHPVLRS